MALSIRCHSHNIATIAQGPSVQSRGGGWARVQYLDTWRRRRCQSESTVRMRLLLFTIKLCQLSVYYYLSEVSSRFPVIHFPRGSRVSDKVSGKPVNDSTL